jgi:D-arabinitol dehydrogenase (NADP+)
MRAVRYESVGQPIVRDMADIPLGQGELRLKVLASGVCPEDLLIHHGGWGATYPLTPGHEMVGEVIELGRGSGKVSLGDLLVVDTAIPCGWCDMCQSGRPTQCVRLLGYGLHLPGSAAEHIVVDAARAVAIGDMDVDTAVLAEPIACAVHALDVLAMRTGSTVLVIGGGPNAQLLSQLLARGGASSVTVAAPSPHNLDVAVRNGATRAVITDNADFAASFPELLDDEPQGFDVVIDTTGHTAQPVNALPLVRGGGTFFLYGMTDEHAAINIRPYDVFRRELRIVGAFSQTNCVGRAVDLLAARRVVADGIITHRFGLDQYPEAIAAVQDPMCLKAVVYPQLAAG